MSVGFSSRSKNLNMALTAANAAPGERGGMVMIETDAGG
jgi:hypothetical protein